MLPDIVSFLLKNKEMKLLESLLKCLLVKERTELTSSLKPNDLQLLLANSLQFGLLNSTIHSLFPCIDDRQNFLKSEVFVNIVSSFIETKQLSDLDEIFSSLFSNFGDIKSYKKQFVDERGFDLCKKFCDDGNWECIDDFVKWNLSCQDEIISFYKKNLYAALLK